MFDQSTVDHQRQSLEQGQATRFERWRAQRARQREMLVREDRKRQMQSARPRLDTRCLAWLGRNHPREESL